MSETKHSFTCDFGDGVTATAVIDVVELRRSRGKTGFIAVEWSGQRKDSHKSTYLKWMLEVYQAAAELLPGRILYAFTPRPNKYEFYRFEPGMPPTKVDKPPQS